MTTTICDIFLTNRSSRAEAIVTKQNGKWKSYAWTDYFEKSEKIAAGLYSLGARPGDKIALLSNTRHEWAFADMAILGLHAVTVPIYYNSTQDDIKFILNDSQAKILICEQDEHLCKWDAIEAQCPTIKKVVCIEKQKDAAANCLSWNDLIHLGSQTLNNQGNLFSRLCTEVRADQLATIVYTSGTTGQPKGVLLNHEQIMSEVQDLMMTFNIGPNDRSLSFLPFAHILGRVEHWLHILSKFTLAFAESLEKIPDNLRTIQPTVLVGVPRIFEKIYLKIKTAAEISPTRFKLFNWATQVGLIASQHRQQRKALPLHLLPQLQLARKLVFDRITENLGGHLRFAICGGAPLNKDIAQFFHSTGLLILDGYGLTESTAAVTCNTPFDYEFGTVGKPLPDVEINLAEDGEILVKSKKVMQGYLNQTEQSIKNGYLHTGDLGKLTPSGNLVITGRKKDLIKTAGGKYIAPQKVEGILGLSTYISHSLIHGDQEKHAVALITLDQPAVRVYAEKHDISFKDFAALTRDPRIKSLIRKAVAQANSHLASHETIKNFTILPHDFSIETGELTPSQKVKRGFCDQKYKKEISRLYRRE